MEVMLLIIVLMMTTQVKCSPTFLTPVTRVLSFRVLKFVRMCDKLEILREMILAATSQPRPLDKPQGGPEADFFAQP